MITGVFSVSEDDANRKCTTCFISEEFERLERLGKLGAPKEIKRGRKQREIQNHMLMHKFDWDFFLSFPKQ